MKSKLNLLAYLSFFIKRLFCLSLTFDVDHQLWDGEQNKANESARITELLNHSSYSLLYQSVDFNLSLLFL